MYTEAYGNCKEDKETDIWCIRNAVWAYGFRLKERTESVSVIWKEPYGYKEYVESTSAHPYHTYGCADPYHIRITHFPHIRITHTDSVRSNERNPYV